MTVFNNLPTGRLVRTGATGGTPHGGGVVDAVFNNDGLVEVQVGILFMGRPGGQTGTSSGTFLASTDAELNFSGPMF